MEHATIETEILSYLCRELDWAHRSMGIALVSPLFTSALLFHVMDLTK
jgi:hypothetical protein